MSAIDRYMCRRRDRNGHRHDGWDAVYWDR